MKRVPFRPAAFVARGGLALSLCALLAPSSAFPEEAPRAAQPAVEQQVEQALRLWRDVADPARARAMQLMQAAGARAFPVLVQQTYSKDPVAAQQAALLLQTLGWPDAKLVEPVSAWPPQEAARFWATVLTFQGRQMLTGIMSGHVSLEYDGRQFKVKSASGAVRGLAVAQTRKDEEALNIAFAAIQALSKIDPRIASEELQNALKAAIEPGQYYLLRALAAVPDPGAAQALKLAVQKSPADLTAAALLARRGEKEPYLKIRREWERQLMEQAGPQKQAVLGEPLYRLARFDALAGFKPESMRLLTRAVQEGVLDARQIWNDPSFYELRADPSFRGFVKELEGKPVLAAPSGAPEAARDAEKEAAAPKQTIKVPLGVSPEGKGYLGVQMGAPDGVEPGVRIGGLVPGGAAEKAGLRPGDRILSVDGQAVSGMEGVAQAVQKLEPGRVVQVEVARDPSKDPSALGVKWFAAVTPDYEGEVQKLIQQMGVDDFDARQEAMRRIRVQFGPVAEPYLEKAAQAEDREIARRSQDLLQQLEQLQRTVDHLLQARQAEQVQALQVELQMEIQKKQQQLQQTQQLQIEIQQYQQQYQAVQQELGQYKQQMQQIQQLHLQRQKQAQQLQLEIQKRQQQLQQMQK